MRFCLFLFLWITSHENAAEKNAFSDHSFMEKEAMMCKTKRLAQNMFMYSEKHMLFQKRERYDAQFIDDKDFLRNIMQRAHYFMGNVTHECPFAFRFCPVLWFSEGKEHHALLPIQRTKPPS